MTTTRTTYTVATAASELTRIIDAYSLTDELDRLLLLDHPDAHADRAIALTALDTIRAAQVELVDLDAIEQARQNALDVIVETKRRLDALTSARSESLIDALAHVARIIQQRDELLLLLARIDRAAPRDLSECTLADPLVDALSTARHTVLLNGK